MIFACAVPDTVRPAYAKKMSYPRQNMPGFRKHPPMFLKQGRFTLTGGGRKRQCTVSAEPPGQVAPKLPALLSSSTPTRLLLWNHFATLLCPATETLRSISTPVHPAMTKSCTSQQAPTQYSCRSFHTASWGSPNRWAAPCSVQQFQSTSKSASTSPVHFLDLMADLWQMRPTSQYTLVPCKKQSGTSTVLELGTSKRAMSWFQTTPSWPGVLICPTSLSLLPVLKKERSFSGSPAGATTPM
mmetsp:Transcript_3618/g.6315  ORF Transcript_3618/g.6315 Transcript_3618/m.6315 type:complete len:242 (+) Transcript_3618:2011-2736(+)